MLRSLNILHMYVYLTVFVVLFVLFQHYQNEMLQLKRQTKEIVVDIKEYSKFLVDTPGCKILHRDPFDSSIIHLIKNFSNSKLNCSSPQLFFLDGDVLRPNSEEMEKLIKKWGNVQCEYIAIERYDELDWHFKKIRRPINGDIGLKDEFVRVECYTNSMLVYQDFFAVIVKKSHVESRILQDEKKWSSSKKMSVLLLGLDAVSKSQYRRHLVQSDKFIREKLNFVEFDGYNSLGPNTFINMLPLHTGKFENEFNFRFFRNNLDSLPLIWKEFAGKGYRTLFAEDAPTIATFNTHKRGFRNSPTDYYLRPFSLAVEESYLNCLISNDCCFPNRTESSVILKWMLDFFDKFKQNPLFAYVFLTRLSHKDYNKVAFQDREVLTALKYLHSNGHLESTIIFYFSDHGSDFGDLRLTDFGYEERKLPFFFLILPPWFSKNHPIFYENLKVNQKRLITSFDIHATLRDIANLFTNVEQSPIDTRSISLFTPVPSNRTCEMASIDYFYCSCVSEISVSGDEENTNKVGKMLVDFINKRTSKHRVECAEVFLSRVMSVKSGKERKTSKIVIYLVTVQVEPSKAIFQGVVRYDEEDGSFTPDFSVDRLNSYENQSDCVINDRLKEFCYCYNQTEV